MNTPPTTESDQVGSLYAMNYSSSPPSGTIDAQTVMDADGSTDFSYAYDEVNDPFPVTRWQATRGLFCVINADVNNAYQTLVCVDESGHRHWQFRISNTGKLEFQQIGGSNPTIASTDTLSTGTRYTVGVGEVGGTNKLYIDGAVAASGGGAPVFPTVTVHGVPNVARNNFGNNQYYNGRIGSLVFLQGTVTDAMFSGLHSAWTGA